MQKNLIFAVVLSSLVYIGWYSFVEKKIQPQKAPAAQAQQAAQTAAQPAAAPAAAAATVQTSLPENWKEKAVKFKAGKAEYYFNPGTAALGSVVYEGPVAPVELVTAGSPGIFAAAFPARFRLTSQTPELLEFQADLPGDIRVYRKYRFPADGGLPQLMVMAENRGRKEVVLPAWEMTIGPGLGTVASEQKENASLWKAEYAYSEDGRKHPTLKEIEDDEPASHVWAWAGVSNRYFLAALIEGDEIQKLMPVRRTQMLGKDKAPLMAVPFPAVALQPGGKHAWAANFYVGPKDYALLQKLGHGLDRSVDFGFFAPIAKLAESALVYFHKMTGNYGVAILILSLLIQLLLTPLSVKSYKAMAVMKKIQPEMQSIQQRYKEDPQRMNREIMDLYKRHGTNPVGGCLPMLLQLPIFFALFNALRNSWNLHGANFVFWIKDLSAKDPYYVLPLIMGGVMFLQQHLSPQTSDPAQAAMMKWMPVIFTFMFLTFPSGLVLYWLINSLWGFAQSMYLQKKMA